jgi:hypothetical protein
MARRRLATCAIACAMAACGLDLVGVGASTTEPDAGARTTGDSGSAPVDGATSGGPAKLYDCRDADIGAFERCYFVAKPAMKRDEAKLACADAGYHLVTPRNATEQAFVADASARQAAERWIGLVGTVENTGNDKSKYAWITGEKDTFDGWIAGDPNGNFPCVIMLSDRNQQWADRGCDEGHEAICERDR